MHLICELKRKSRRGRGNSKSKWVELNGSKKVWVFKALTDLKAVKMQGKVQAARRIERLSNRIPSKILAKEDYPPKRVNRDHDRIRNGVAEQGHRLLLAERL